VSEAVKVGVIGTGMIGALHARNLATRLKSAELVAVADADVSRAQEIGGDVGATAYADGLELISDPRVEAVVIASPDPTHAEYVLACLDAGKPVMCEKPLATTGDDALRVIERESAYGRRMVQVGFMRQFDPEHVALREVIAAGRIGERVMFRGIHVNPTVGDFRASPDIVITSSIIHDIHSARYLMGQEFDTVYVTSIPREPGQADTCRLLTISCTFADGAIGLMDVNIEAGYGYAVSAEVVGTRGTVATAHPRLVQMLADGERREEIAGGFRARFGEAYLAELDAWLQSVTTGKAVGPSSWDGYASLAVADACRESVRTGLPVKVEMRDPFGLYAEAAAA
jgi:myo-inositol 2-dehydrogenase/D-chiro-inositol 1-dehydrogenase